MFASYLKGRMKEPVRILFFRGPRDEKQGEDLACTYCYAMDEILKDLSETSDLIQIDRIDYAKDHPLVLKHQIERIPAIVLLDPDGNDPGVRFFGVTSEQEFTPLIEDVAQLSGKDHSLYWEISQRLDEGMQGPVHIRVFVTVSCPYCPEMVRLSHQLAMIYPEITAEMIEVAEFQNVARKFNVMTVPLVTFNDTIGFNRGGISDEIFAAFVVKASGGSVSPEDQARMDKFEIQIQVSENKN